MPADFSEMEQSIIKNMMLRKSHKDISKLLDGTVEDIASFIAMETKDTDVITWQMKLDANRPPKTDRTRVPKEKPVPSDNKRAEEKKLAFEKREQKRINQIERMNVEQKRATQRRQPAFKTIFRDYSKMILVKIDHQTHIYVNPGDDIAAAKRRYLLQIERSKASYLASEVKPERHKTVKKTCSRCGNEKPLDEFAKNRATKDGTTAMCRDCEYSSEKIKRAEAIENSRF